MRGGVHLFDQVFCMRNWVAAAVLGILSIASTPFQVCEAHDDHSGDCETSIPAEQSIVVSIGKTENGSTIAIATDQEDSLEPIAKVSENVPDLADSVPTLAKPRIESGTEPAERLAAMPAKPQLEEQSVLEQPVAEDSATAKQVANGEKSNAPEAISFMGITPGISHRTDLFREWGDPRNEDTYEEVLNYKFDNFESVEAKFDGNIVDAIIVTTGKPVPVQKLKERLGLAESRPAEIADNSGNMLAQAYPERGVVLYSPKHDPAQVAQDFQVSKIEIQPIKAEGFIIRAENDYLRSSRQPL